MITSNASHPAFRVESDNLHIIYQEHPSPRNALERLKMEYNCERLTVQSGGTVNGLFLREKLLDYVDIVVAPILIGGKDTPTLIDGRSLISVAELSELGGGESDGMYCAAGLIYQITIPSFELLAHRLFTCSQ